MEEKEQEVLFEDRLKGFLNGDTMRDFFSRHLKTCLIITLLMFAYIGNRYACEDVMARVNETQTAIKEVKYEILCVSTELVELSRQSHLRDRLHEHGVNIEISNNAPIEIK